MNLHFELFTRVIKIESSLRQSFGVIKHFAELSFAELSMKEKSLKSFQSSELKMAVIPLAALAS